MGLFKTITSIFKAVKEEKDKEKLFLSMSYQELKDLDDELLFEALSCRILNEEESMDVDECLDTFKGAKRVFYIVNYFDMEVQNGGLCQFFVNSSRMVAPYILNCLHEINAIEYETLLNGFISKHDISLNNLDSFILDDIDDYEKQVERYPFDDFDDKYYDLYEEHPLEKYLLEYCKKYLNEF